MATLTRYATSYEEDTGYVDNPSNAYNALSDSTYARVYEGSVIFHGFNFSSLPSNSIVSSVQFKIDCQQQSYGKDKYSHTMIYVNGSYKGYVSPYTEDQRHVYSISFTDITAAQLRASTTTTFFNVEGYSPSEYLDLYGMAIIVTYSLPTFAITSSAGTGGTISPSGTTNVTSGANQTFTITPSSGYEIDVLTVDGSAASPTTTTPTITYVFTNVTTTHSISVTFKSSFNSNGFFHSQYKKMIGAF